MGCNNKILELGGKECGHLLPFHGMLMAQLWAQERGYLTGTLDAFIFTCSESGGVSCWQPTSLYKQEGNRGGFGLQLEDAADTTVATVLGACKSYGC